MADIEAVDDDVAGVDEAAGGADGGFDQIEIGGHQVHRRVAGDCASRRGQRRDIELVDIAALIGRHIEHDSDDLELDFVGGAGDAVRVVEDITQIPDDTIVESIGVSIAFDPGGTHHGQTGTGEISADTHDLRRHHLQHAGAGRQLVAHHGGIGGAFRQIDHEAIRDLFADGQIVGRAEFATPGTRLRG